MRVNICPVRCILMLDLCLLLRETPGAVNSTQVLVNLRKSNLRIGPVKLEAEVWSDMDPYSVPPTLLHIASISRPEPPL